MYRKFLQDTLQTERKGDGGWGRKVVEKISFLFYLCIFDSRNVLLHSLYNCFRGPSDELNENVSEHGHWLSFQLLGMYPKEIPKQDRKLPHQTAYPHEIISTRTARFVPILFSSVLKHLLQRLTHRSHSGNTYWLRALKYTTAFSGEFC